MKCIVVDYGVGNIGSIVNMLKWIGVAAQATSNPDVINSANKIILPGVGAFDLAVDNLERAGFIDVLNKKALQERIPILGICLGAQLMTRGSQEGHRPGLGWIPAQTIKFAAPSFSDKRLKIPHMGWREVTIQKENPLIKCTGEARYYFVHSYHFVCEEKTDILASALYGYEFTAAFSRENIFGVQFHPEKSHKYGIELLRNFMYNVGN